MHTKTLQHTGLVSLIFWIHLFVNFIGDFARDAIEFVTTGWDKLTSVSRDISINDANDKIFLAKSPNLKAFEVLYKHLDISFNYIEVAYSLGNRIYG